MQQNILLHGSMITPDIGLNSIFCCLKMKSVLNILDFIFRQQENLVDNQKCQAGFRPLCNKILLGLVNYFTDIVLT